MAVGQSAFTVAADVAALDALGLQLAVDELDRGAVHARQLRTLLQLHALDTAAGMSIATVANAALLLGSSEARAGRLLNDALLLGSLPGGLEAVACGLLTVEQSHTVVEHLDPLPLATRLVVWQRLQQRLVDVADQGSVLPPARLAELLRRWVRAAAPEEAVERRKRAEAGRDVDYRLRGDGLGDLYALGLRGPDLHAVLARIRSRAVPVGPWDDRTAGQRRADAFVDLLLGRDPFPQEQEDGRCAGPAGGGRAGCGCWPGSAVPCGADLVVHVPLSTALDMSDEPAELVGHGPLEADLLGELMLASPRVRAVWTDVDGVPVAVSDRVLIPERGDPASVRGVLLDIARSTPPGLLHPRHARDHPPDPSEPPKPPRTAARAPDASRTTLVQPALARLDADDACSPAAAAVGATRTGSGSHPEGQPGPYRVPRALRRLIEVRSPRCEWPGCGARAVRCDAEHDRAWPYGPTCACNLGPCCRRHHRIKQLGWMKTRHTGSAVTWSSPYGRGWRSADQHQPPAAATHAMPHVPTPNPFDELSPGELEDELWALGLLPDDPEASELQLPEPTDEGEGRDVLGEHLSNGDTRWTLDLDDPYRWYEPTA